MGATEKVEEIKEREIRKRNSRKLETGGRRRHKNKTSNTRDRGKRETG